MSPRLKKSDPLKRLMKKNPAGTAAGNAVRASYKNWRMRILMDAAVKANKTKALKKAALEKQKAKN